MFSPRQFIFTCVLLLASMVSGGATATASELPDLDPLRFANEIMAFQEWEAKNTLPEGGILFVGSSSIRMWPTAVAFPDKVVINTKLSVFKQPAVPGPMSPGRVLPERRRLSTPPRR